MRKRALVFFVLAMALFCQFSIPVQADEVTSVMGESSDADGEDTGNVEDGKEVNSTVEEKEVDVAEDEVDIVEGETDNTEDEVDTATDEKAEILESESEETEILCWEYLSEEKAYSGNAADTIPNEDLNGIKGISNFSVTADFKTSSTELQSLVALNGDQHPNDYISLYISSGNRIGFEVRNYSGASTVNYHKYVDIADVNFADNEWHTVTFVVTENESYQIYLDQTKVYEQVENQTYFLGTQDWWELASCSYGGAKRISGNSYLYTGSLKNIKLYNGAISEDQIMKDHGRVDIADPILTYGKNEFNGTEDAMVVINEDAAQIGSLTQGTFSFAYRLNDAHSSALNGLLSISDSGQDKTYGAFYVNPDESRIGFEVQGGAGHVYVTVPGTNPLQNTDWHTVTFVMNGEKATFYWDGKLIGTSNASSLLQGDTWTANAATIGGIQRATDNAIKKWPFDGVIDSVNIFEVELDEQQVAQLHKDTLPETVPVYGEDVVKTGEYGIFDMGDYDSYNYRIPALVTTANGIVVAAADQRNTHWSDWGDINSVVRRSTDNGQTWEEPITVIDLKSQPYFSGTQSAFTIDSALLAEDGNGVNPGRVWMLVDMFPESTNGAQGTNSVKTTGTGYVQKEGKDYLALYDASGNEYTLRENGEVYDSQGAKTDYVVHNGAQEDGYHQKGDLYENGEYVGNIYLRSTNTGNDSAPLHPFQSSYLWLCYSDDDGKTWSEPVDITPQVKESWMRFCGAGPGFGIQIKNDPQHENRLVFPIYYTIAGSGIGFQSSACIYSDDGGTTWVRGESPNDGRTNSSGKQTSSQNPSGISELTESQIIELSSGNLLQFMRNHGGAGKVAVSRSTDGGATWSDPIDTEAKEVYCQLSALYLDNQGTDGKDRVLLSNPGGSGRNNGTLRIGEVTENEKTFSIDWVKEKMFCPGNYAYSCLTRMGDGNFGLLYEHNNTIKFTSFNLEYISDEVNLLSPVISSVTYHVEKDTEHEYTLAGDRYLFTVKVDQKVEVNGNPQFRFLLSGESKYADYLSIDEDNQTLTFVYTVQPEDEGQIAFRGPKIISGENGSVTNVYGYSVESGDMNVDLGYIGMDPSDSGRDIPVEAIANATAGSAHSDAGADKVLDGNASTLWHTEWAQGHGRENHWIQFELDKNYTVDGLRYQPRQSGGTNGIIVKYRVEVSDDGVNFTTAAEGKWAPNTAWKKVSFAPVTAKYVRLVSVDALSMESANDYASAAEIRITGTEFKDTEAPSMPADLKVDSVEKTSADISWGESTDNIGVVKYIVIAPDGTQTDVTETTFHITGLKPNTEYTYSVKAIDAAGNESEAAEITVVTLKEDDGQKPGTDTPDDQKPGTDTPDDQKPGTDTPDDQKPGTENPGGQKPGTDAPGGQKPGTENPGNGQPGTDPSGKGNQNLAKSANQTNKPAGSGTANAGKPKGETPKTADTTPVFAYGALTVLALVIMAVLVALRRKRIV